MFSLFFLTSKLSSGILIRLLMGVNHGHDKTVYGLSIYQMKIMFSSSLCVDLQQKRLQMSTKVKKSMRYLMCDRLVIFFFCLTWRISKFDSSFHRRVKTHSLILIRNGTNIFYEWKQHTLTKIFKTTKL